MKKLLYLILITGLIVSCSTSKWVLTGSSAQAIPIDKSTDASADQEMIGFIAPYKEQLDREMGQVIGTSAVAMRAGKPESLLSNWNADVYRKAATEFLGEPIDLAIVNMGSLRAPIPKGDVTVGHIFQLMPFENELVILYLKGSEIKTLFDIFALEGGQGISGAQIDIRKEKVERTTIGGEPIADDRVYSIATNDFLAAGNDRMIPLASPVKRIDTHLKVRNVLMEEVVRAGQEGRELQAQLDERIRIFD